MKVKLKLFLGFLLGSFLLTVSFFYLFLSTEVAPLYFRVVFLILILFSFAEFFLVINYVLKPLKVLIQEAAFLAEGNLKTFTSIKSKDELEALEKSLNLISESWQKNLAEGSQEVKSAQEHLRKTFSRLSQAITSVLDLKELLILILDITKEELQLEKIFLYLVDPQTQEMDFKLGRGLNNDSKEFSQENWVETALRVAQNREPLQGKVAEIFPPLASLSSSNGKENFAIVSPLVVKENISGVIVGEREERKGNFSGKDLELLTTLTNQAAIALDNARLYQQTQLLAVTDGLTHLYNHRFFQERLSEELARAERFQRPLALLMIDIDYFKKYNDEFGHPQGDLVLKEIAKILMKSSRLTDLAARYGGEEFALILPETPKQGAKLLAERIMSEVRKHKFPGKDLLSPMKMNVSTGVALFPREATTPEELIKKADRKLYQAKKEGRNRIVI